ncbi:hypothetical protein PACTADRAFT_75520 [Pachysolen tannophilus NRRL Y-2460]|uniref:Uncharacterized protein n=1 Tax=Pachysolen tannophilus NRRL Y-2460 TaxID=669874 RepID=A0A1E4TX99_PACTA|nr:hypothetical protein PACTADRAFT_75520 [Pachysolen tannophilus NRRL Y-2460]
MTMILGIEDKYIFLVSGLIVSLLLSYKQLFILYNKYKKTTSAKASTKSSGKKSYSSSKDDPIPQPTPLMITPEQVANYDDRPWRPFRWPYHQTMSIFKLDVNHWLDMDKYYVHYIEEKKRIIHRYGDENIGWLPGSEDACLELMQFVKDHMLKRYPLLFSSEDNGIHVKNHLTGEILDFSEPLKEPPLIYVSKMAKEDFYLVKKNPEDDRHYLVAAVVPFPGGSFGIKHKLGKHLDVIHSEVPYYESKLKKSMERWFERMAPADLVERASWYISWDHKLLCNNVYALKEGEKVDSDVAPDQFNVRVERQTLRRLPKSQAIIFTNHPVFYSIDEMKDEPLIPSLIKKIIYEAPEGISKYKNFESFRDHIVKYLDGLIERQIELGLIKEDTPIKTLPSYPFAHFVDNKDVNYGWTNPTVKDPEKNNYIDVAKEEIRQDELREEMSKKTKSAEISEQV